jgi:predicted dehydrogenase
MHAPIAMTALRHDKHVYCQKPLTHEIYETRRLTEEAARRPKLATQMGIQIHSNTEYRLAVELIRSGAIGKVKQAHVWSNKTWGGNAPRPAGSDPVPDTLNWDHWLGVAPERPYVKGAYHPGDWRRWLDFGTGTLGDMGCHIFSPVFAALGLTAPVAARSEGDTPGVEQWAIRGLIHYTFPATQYTVAGEIPVTWYDGGMPVDPAAAALLGDYKLPGQGSIIIGEKGVMLTPHVGGPRLFPQEQYANFAYPKLGPDNHWTQFIDVALGERKATLAGFDFAGPLTETVLMGNIAARYRSETLKWDAANLKFTNKPEANAHLRRAYRKGWEVEGLS